MDFSKLKLEVYDFLGILLPGLLALCEGWICLRGWHQFVATLNQMSGTSVTLFLFVAFGLGHIVQELGDISIKTVMGDRFFQRARDKFWDSPEGQIVRDLITKDIGKEILSADTAFDYCLTKLKERFSKRDVFVATSDLCRSIVVLSFLALMPAIRITLHDIHPFQRSILPFAFLLLVLASTATLAWKRMVRFRALAEATVFRAYLATLGPEPSVSVTSTHS